MRYIDEHEAEERYREFINEVEPPIFLCGLEYSPAQVLAAVDETAFRCGLLDWLDSEGLTIDESEADEDEDKDE